MKVSNYVSIAGQVIEVFYKDVKCGVELRMAVRILADRISDTVVVCMRTYREGEEIPAIKEGMWISAEGTLRVTHSPEKYTQCFLSITEPVVIMEKSEQIPHNCIIAAGNFGDPEDLQIRDSGYSAAFSVFADDPVTGHVYVYSCAVPPEAINRYREAKQHGGSIFVLGRLLIIPEKDTKKVSAIILADVIIPMHNEEMRKKVEKRINVFNIDYVDGIVEVNREK